MTEHIEFRKARNFSEVLTDTFQFTRQNIKVLSLHLLMTLGWAVVFVSIYSAYFIPRASELAGGGFDLFRFIEPFLPMLLVDVVIKLYFSCLIFAYIIHYMDRGYDQFEIRDVLSLAVSNYGHALLAFMITALLVMVGAAIFILPGIYLMVPLSFLLIIIFREEIGVFESVPRAFQLTAGNWWNTFALLLVLVVVVYLLGTAIAMPQIILEMIIELNAGKIDSPGHYKLLSATLGIFVNFINYIIYSILYVGVAFQYFSLVEQKEVPGLLKRIDAIEKSESGNEHSHRKDSAGLSETQK